MADYLSVRDRYTAEFPLYRSLAAWADRQLCVATRELGILGSVSSRPKDPSSFLAKAFLREKNYEDPLLEITDKAAARVVVKDFVDRDRLRDGLPQFFVVESEEDAADRLNPHEFGYLGLHFLVSPKPEDLAKDEFFLEGRLCELQVHTLAQSAWAVNEHGPFYKAGAANPRLRRRVNRLVALVELFDDEMRAVRMAIEGDPGFVEAHLLTILKRHYLPVATDPISNDDLSLKVLASIQGAFLPEEIEEFDELIGAFVLANRGLIKELLGAYVNDERRSPLLYQPEVLAIFERLVKRPRLLRSVWDEHLDPAMLDRLSEALGRPA